MRLIREITFWCMASYAALVCGFTVAGVCMFIIGCAPNARYASLVTIVMRDGQVERVTAGADELSGNSGQLPTTQPSEPNEIPLPWE